MNPTKKAFLLDVLKVTPKTKLFGTGDDSVQATTAFKQYRKEEEALIAQIKTLDEFSGSDAEAEKQVAVFEAEVKTALAHTETAKKGNPKDVKAKVEEALKMLQATKAKLDTAVPVAKARQQFNKAANHTRLLLEKLKMTSTSGKAVETDIAYTKGANVELNKKRATADDFNDGATSLQKLKNDLKGGGLKKIIEEVDKTVAAEEKEQAAFETRRTEFQKHLTILDATERGSDTAVSFRTILQNASQSAREHKYSEATAALTAKLKDLEEATRISKAAKGDQDKQVVKQPDYERRLPKIIARMENLKQVPGSGQKVREFQGELTKAASMAKASDFLEAYKTLDPLKDKIDKTIKELNEAFSKATKTIKDPSVPEVEAEIEKLRAHCTNEEVAVHELRLHGILDKLMQDQDEKAAKKALGQLRGIVKGQNDARAKLVGNFETEVTEVENKLEQLKQCVPFEKYEACQTEFKKTVQAAEDLKYSEAAKNLGVLSGDIDKFIAEVEKDQQKWEAKAKDIASLRARLDKLNSLILSSGAGTLGKEIRSAWEAYQKSLDQANNEKDYKKALDLLKAAGDAVDAVEKKAKPLTDLYDQKQAVRKRFFDRVDEPFVGPNGAMAQLQKAAGKDFKITDLGQFYAESEKVRETFRTAVMNARDKSETDAAFVSSSKEMGALEDQVRKAMKNGAVVARLQTEKKTRAANKVKEDAYNVAAANARQKLDEIQAMGGGDHAEKGTGTALDPDKIKQLEDNYTSYSKDASSDFEQRKKDMEKLADSAKKFAEAFKAANQKTKAQADKKFKDAKETLKKLPKEVPAEYKKEIELRLEKLQALSSSSNKDCLDLVLEEAAELEKDLDAAGKNKDKFADNETEIENLKGRLNKALRKHMPEKVKELEKELKSLKAKIKTQKPLDAADALKKFADKVGEAEGQCGEIATYRYKFDERLPDARAGLEKLSEALKSASGGKHKKYQGVFVKKLAEAEELQARETSSDVEKAITSLDEIIKKIGELAAASDKAGQEGNLSPLVTEENNRLAVEDELKIELKKWETEYKNFKEGPCKLAEAAVKSAKGRGDNKQLQFIIDLGEKAHDFGKDAKDIATLNVAREQLEAAIRNAEDLAETPEGGTTISKKKIAKLKVEWRDRVKAFKASLKSMEDAVIERSAGR